MPVIKVKGGWKIGRRGKARYKSKKSAERAYRGYLGAKYGKK